MGAGAILYAATNNKVLGSNTITFSGTNAGVVVDGRTLSNTFRIQGGLSSNNGAVQLRNAATLNGPIELLGNAGIGSFNGIATIGGVVSGSANHALTFDFGFSDTSSVRLTAANTFSGTVAFGTTRTAAAGIILVNSDALQFSTLSSFGGSAAQSQIQFDQSVAGRVFTVGGLSGVAGSLKLENNAATPAGITLRVGNNNGSTTLSGTLSGAGGMTKIGSGTLTLAGSNSYGGATQVTAGVLALGASNVLSGSTAVTVGGGEMRMGANSNAVASFAITSGSLTGSGKLTAATYALGGGTVGANLGGGALAVSANSALNGTSDATTVNLNAGVLTLGSGGTRFTSNLVAVSGSAGAGLTLGGAEAFGSLAGAANVALGGSILSVGSADTSTSYSGTLSGAGGLTKLGSGTFTLSGGNTYGGSTQVSAGVLALGASNVLSGSTAVTVGGGEMSMGANSNTVASFAITSGSLTGSGKLTAATYGLGGGTVAANLGSGALAVSANSGLNGTSDATTVNLNAGVLTLGSGGTRFTSNLVAVSGSAGAGLTLGGAETFGSLAGAANVALGGSTLSVGSANTSTTYFGTLSGAGGLTKLGSGTFTLAGLNSYLGVTTVSAGVIAVDGRIAGSADVGSGATLGGSGLIEGNIGGAGLIAPGNSPGILAVNGQLNATGSTAFAFELSQTGAPVWSDAANSRNDVLRLTATSPFTSSLVSTNIVNVYFDVSSLANGDTFLGGFFVDNPNGTANLLDSGLGTSTFQYFVKGDGQGGYAYNNVNYYSLDQYISTASGITGVTQSSVPVTSANFSGGTITTGQVTQFVIVPEPSSLVLLGIAAALVHCQSRRRFRRGLA